MGGRGGGDNNKAKVYLLASMLQVVMLIKKQHAIFRGQVSYYLHTERELSSLVVNVKVFNIEHS